MGYIYDVHQYIRFTDLVQSALEGFYKLGGEFAYESYCVAEQEGNVFYDNLPDRSVESCEQFVFCKHIRLGEQVHQCAFAYICITYKGQAHQFSSVSSLCGHLPVYLAEFLF